jgi:hypothetical protein
MQITSASDGTILIDGKVVTALDRFVASVTEIIEQYARYVIVSGYVAILFGRARGTEDIDLFIDYMDRDTFRSFAGELLARGFYFLNSDDVGEIYSMLRDGLAVRIAEEERIIPNVEMKFKKDDFDRYAMTMELGFDREKNRQERLAFVRRHALWVRRVPNEVWSREQADLIDAFLANAGSYALSRARYLEIHQALAKRRRTLDLRDPQRPHGGVLRSGGAGRDHLTAR